VIGAAENRAQRDHEYVDELVAQVGGRSPRIFDVSEVLGDGVEQGKKHGVC